jgi:hypothetical protein
MGDVETGAFTSLIITSIYSRYFKNIRSLQEVNFVNKYSLWVS